MSEKIVGIILAVVAAIAAIVLFFKKEGGAQPPVPECNPGETKCMGYDSYRCSADSIWQLDQANAEACGWQPGEPEFEVTDLVIDPPEIYVGEKAILSVMVTNIGEKTGTKTVVLEGMASKDVTLTPGESYRVSFEVLGATIGLHTMAVGGLQGTLTVLKVPQAEFELSNLIIQPEQVYTGHMVAITVTVTNVGDAAGTTTITCELTGMATQTKSVTLDVGESTDVSFEATPTKAGLVTVKVDSLEGSFEVLIPTSAVSGTITVDGVDIRGLEVSVAGMVKVTDVEGRFYFAAVPHGAYTLTITDPQGHYMSKSLDVTVGEEDVDLGYITVEEVPPAPTVRVYGHVTNATTGEPYSYAPLSFPGYGGHPGYLTEADQNGWYDIDIQPGVYCPVVRPTLDYDTYYPTGGPHSYVNFTSDTEYNIKVPPKPPPPPPPPTETKVYGIVKYSQADRQGYAVGAEVKCYFEQKQGSYQARKLVGKMTVGKDGRYTILLPESQGWYPASYSVRAFSECGNSRTEYRYIKYGETVSVDLYIH